LNPLQGRLEKAVRYSAADSQRDQTVSPEASGELYLLKRIQDRDERAFEQLYRGYHARLVRFLLNLTRRPQLVEEVLNDTMIVVWEKPASFRGTSKLSTWIFGIAYRKAMKALRRFDEAVEYCPVDGPDEDAVSAHELIWRGQREHLVLEFMQRLSTDHRAVVDLTYFHEMSYREIAEVMDCPVDTVKTRMFHARRRLKHLMSDAPGDWF
jgi:RNA polymerase sigma-70 factor (ECF subfamily)